jgi:hypothetical protein
MKAYIVRERTDTDAVCYVKAETPEQARHKALRAEEGDGFRDAGYAELRARRAPQFDASMTEIDLVRAGVMWTECSGCARMLRGIACVERDTAAFPGEDEEGPAVVADGGIWCCGSCRERHGVRIHNRWEGEQLDAICLYADY